MDWSPVSDLMLSYIDWLTTSLASVLRETHISQMQSHRNWEMSWWNPDQRSGCFPGANTRQDTFSVSREGLEMEKEMWNIWTARGEVVGGIFIFSVVPLPSLLPCSIWCLLKSSCQCLLNSVSTEGMQPLTWLKGNSKRLVELVLYCRLVLIVVLWFCEP